MPPALRALNHRDYRLFASGQLVSLIGTWMQTVAQSWLIYRLTDSAALLGLVVFASQFPVFLFSSVGGLVADRLPRGRVVMITQTGAMLLAFTLAALTLTDTVVPWHVFVLASLLGVCNAFDMPARQSFVTELVPAADLPNAIALNAAVFNGARILGPALAGVLVTAVGEGWCFLGNGVSFLAVLAGLARISHKPAPSRQRQHPLLDLRDGFAFAGRTWPIRTLLLTLAAIGLGGGPYVSLMPIFADRILQGGAQALGILMGASGLGALLGTVVLATRGTPATLWRWVPLALAGFGIALTLFAASRLFWLSTLLLVGVGFALLLSMTSVNTLVQSLVPDQLRGRVMSIYAMVMMGSTPLGGLLAGAVAELIGAPLTTALGGVVTLAAGFWFYRQVGRMRSATASGQELIPGRGRPIDFG
ncbi:MAG: MFS transporter [Spongiibacteraceae bacterium]|jgi:MFS family permease|nr:MFS transporter [Spongiibacteraceae bacterium]